MGNTYEDFVTFKSCQSCVVLMVLLLLVGTILIITAPPTFKSFKTQRLQISPWWWTQEQNMVCHIYIWLTCFLNKQHCLFSSLRTKDVWQNWFLIAMQWRTHLFGSCSYKSDVACFILTPLQSQTLKPWNGFSGWFLLSFFLQNVTLTRKGWLNVPFDS